MAKDKDTYSAWHDWVWRDEIEKAYGGEVLRDLSAFFLFYPDPRGAKALEEVPGILAAIRRQYEDGSTPIEAVVKIGAVILRRLIGTTMDLNLRTKVMKELRELSDQDWEQFRGVAISGGGEIKFSAPIEQATIVIAYPMAFARVALERGNIDQKTFDEVQSLIFEALNDQSPPVTAGA